MPADRDVHDDGPLAPYRVLDLTDGLGLLCGSLLADLGADVLRVEPPGGSPARREPNVWQAWARGSRSVTLDLAAPDDQQKLRSLAAEADVLVESGPPGAMHACGLGYDVLAADHEALVYVSITPFGQTGPLANAPATDLTILAASGTVAMTGDRDRPPLRLGGHQAWAHAGAEAATGTLIALYERQWSGRGQHVDVSAQEAASINTGFQQLAGIVGGAGQLRAGGAITIAGVRLPSIYPALDGYVAINFSFSKVTIPYTARFIEWIAEEGECDESIRDKDWFSYETLVLSGDEPPSEVRRVIRTLQAFVAKRPVDLLVAESARRRLMLSRASTLPQVLDDAHFGARGSWWPANDVDRETTVVGPFARFGRTPLSYRGAAPPEAGVLAKATWRKPRLPLVKAHLPEEAGRPRRALDGVRVLDFSWMMAGPWATRVLADNGATVIKIENPGRMDGIRTLGPYLGGHRHHEHSTGFHSANAGKLSLALDPTCPEGREVALDLVRWADIVADAYSPNVMAKFGLDHERLAVVKPEVISISSSIFGQVGPSATLPGVGTMGSAAAGFIALTGYEGEVPCGPWGPHTDFTAPRLAVVALLAALDHRDRTGEGQHIDFSQAEASLQYLAPELLACSHDGIDFGPRGNTDEAMAPHGVYPAAGDDRWIAIACRDDADWQALCSLAGLTDLSAVVEFATASGRRRHRARIDERITAWTAVQAPEEAERLLLAAGVPASRVVDYRDLALHEQLVDRGHIRMVAHPLHRQVPVVATAVQLSRTRAGPTSAGPLLGEHTRYVLANVLGYDEARIAQLVACGAVPISVET